ncbi:Glutathione synthetase [Brachybacterium faecium]|nr:Glutathione synthetase [Brachybacterium faecium]
MTRIGLVITDPERFPAAHTMLDVTPLLAALRERGAEARAVDWADEEVDWAGFDLVVLRSPWDYSERPAQFDAWLESAGALTRILNEPALVRWNMDKRYLTALAEAGIPGVPTSWHDEEASLADALQEAARRAAGSGAADPSATHVVLKPSVGAGARLAGLLRPDDPAAHALGRQILAERGTVMLQPEIPELSAGHEKALYLIDGHFTHAIAKGALLARGGGLRGGTYRESPQQVEASAAEREFAERVLAATATTTGLEMPLYARIDLVDTAAHGMLLLEAELFEPLFNLQLAPEVTGVFAEAILARA